MIRSKHNDMSEWDALPTPIDTRWMQGEGYQVSLAPELVNKYAYDLDRWAEAWLKKNGYPVKEWVSAHKRDDNTRLCIMSINWKHDAIDEFNREHRRPAA